MDWQSPNYDNNATIKVIVRTKRSSDGRESNNVTIKSTTAITAGPDAITLHVFKRYPGEN